MPDLALPEAYFRSLREQALPAVWNRGVTLSKTMAVKSISSSPAEIKLSALPKGETLSYTIELWPQDEDWHCSCSEKTDPCHHVIAAVLALKNGLISNESTHWECSYELYSKDKKLFLMRSIQKGNEKEELPSTLRSYLGGMQSSRHTVKELITTEEDLAIDLLGIRRNFPIEKNALGGLFRLLSHCKTVALDGSPVKTISIPSKITAKVTKENTGFRLTANRDEKTSTVYENGAVLKENQLRPYESPRLSTKEIELLKGGGTYYPESESHELFSVIVPELRKKIDVFLPEDISNPQKHPLDIVLELKEANNQLLVTPIYTYGYPIMATLRNGVFSLNSPNKTVIRNFSLEKSLQRKLQLIAQIPALETTPFSIEDGLSFLQRIRETELGDRLTVPPSFQIKGTLTPKVTIDDDSFSVEFEIENSSIKTSFDAVYECWKEGDALISFKELGIATLPENWLKRFAERIHRYFQNRSNSDLKSPLLVFEKQDLLEDLGFEAPMDFKVLETSPEQLPSDLTATLRHYQEEGVKWLQSLTSQNYGALLADDMGLGKTLQTLAAIKTPCLIIAPTSVYPSWMEQSKRFRPTLNLHEYWGSSRSLPSTLRENDVLITTHGTLRQDIDQLKVIHWEMTVFDEAQAIKNPSSQLAKAVFSLKSKTRIALSGTPIENHLSELWSIFQYLNPGLLGNFNFFKKTFVTPIQNADATASIRLHRRISPFFLKRLKSEVARDLPEKTEITLWNEFSDDEKETYDSLLLSTKKEVLEKLSIGSVIGALEALLRLRQCCAHRSLLPGESAETSSKLELLVDSLIESKEARHKSLVFSQWTSFLDLIEKRLKKEHFKVIRLDGQTKNREAVVNEFQNGEKEVFLISLKAGGVGITLTAADHVYLTDPWWNPAVEEQAMDRAHRIGQENPVMVYRLITKNSVEQKVMELQEKKKDLAKMIFEPSSSSVTKEDLLALFEN